VCTKWCVPRSYYWTIKIRLDKLVTNKNSPRTPEKEHNISRITDVLENSAFFAIPDIPADNNEVPNTKKMHCIKISNMPQLYTVLC
jgi:hypothetical protein